MKGWLFACLMLTGALFSLTGLRQFFIEPLANPMPNLVWFLIQLLPLLLPLPGVLRLQVRSTFVLCMASTLYFVHGVYVISDPKLQLLGIFEIIFSLGLCAVSAFLVRKLREAEANGTS